MRMAKMAVLAAIAAALVGRGDAAEAKKPGRPAIVASGMGFVEGPTVMVGGGFETRWLGSIYVVDNSQPDGIIWEAVRMGQTTDTHKLQPWVKVGKPGNNGSKMGPDGWLYVASPGQKGILRARRDGRNDKVEWIVTSATVELNGPNDLVFNRNGDFYFTDPSWPKDKPGAVYLRRKSGEVVKIIPGIRTPNGIGLSPDEKTLYIAQSELNKIVKCAVREDGTVGEPEDFIRFEEPGTPDGMRVDDDGTIYQALYSARAVVALSPEGKELWRVPLDWDLPKKKVDGYGVTNCAIAPNGLFVTRTHGGGQKNNGCLIFVPFSEAAKE